MKNNLKVILRYGLILGLVNIAFSVLVYVFDVVLMGMFAGFFISLISLLIIIIALVWSGKHYRNNYNGGYIKYTQALLLAVMIVAVAALVVFCYDVVFRTAIEPGYDERVKTEITQKTVQYMEEKGVPDGEIDKVIDKMNEQKPTPLAIKLVWSFFGPLIFGVIIALITSIFVKKNKPLFDCAEETPDSTGSQEVM